MGNWNLKRDFLLNQLKYINSSTNGARKLIFGQNVHKYEAKKVTEAFFEIFIFFKMAAIFMWKMVKNGEKRQKIAIFHI